MNHKNKLAVGIALLSGLLLVSVTLGQVSASYNAVWSRFASGGGQRQSASYLAQDILGQWVSESPSSAHALIVTDFYWTEEAEEEVPNQLFLPIVIRQ